MLTDIKTFLWPKVRFHEQILDTFVVDLYHRNCNSALDYLGSVSLQAADTFENLVARPRYNSFILAVSDN